MNNMESAEDGVASMPEALGDSVLQSQTLESVAAAVQYHDWLTSLARPYLGDAPIELGSGLGDYAQISGSFMAPVWPDWAIQASLSTPTRR